MSILESVIQDKHKLVRKRLSSYAELTYLCACGGSFSTTKQAALHLSYEMEWETRKAIRRVGRGWDDTLSKTEVEGVVAEFLMEALWR